MGSCSNSTSTCSNSNNISCSNSSSSSRSSKANCITYLQTKLARQDHNNKVALAFAGGVVELNASIADIGVLVAEKDSERFSKEMAAYLAKIKVSMHAIVHQHVGVHICISIHVYMWRYFPGNGCILGEAQGEY
jgi:hypothetical protein